MLLRLNSVFAEDLNPALYFNKLISTFCLDPASSAGQAPSTKKIKAF